MGGSGECSEWLEELNLGHQWVICATDELVLTKLLFPHAHTLTVGENVNGLNFDNCVMTKGAIREAETIMGVEWVREALRGQRRTS